MYNQEQKLQESKKSRKDKKSGTKQFKMNQIEITCENEPKTKYNITSEEFAIHIIDCDSCLKNLFINQAKRKDKESELLLENKKSKKSRHKKSKIRKYFRCKSWRKDST